MLTQKHLQWLNLNDGKYEVLPRQHRFTRDNTEYISKVDVAFNNTMFAFNEKGLSQAIDRIIEVYPESLELKIIGVLTLTYISNQEMVRFIRLFVV